MISTVWEKSAISLPISVHLIDHASESLTTKILRELLEECSKRGINIGSIGYFSNEFESNIFSFDGGSHSISRNNWFEKQTRTHQFEFQLIQILRGGKMIPEPISIVYARNLLRDILNGIPKNTLRNIIREHLISLITTPHITKTILDSYGHNTDNILACPAALVSEFNETKQIIVLNLADINFCETKLNKLILILMAMDNPSIKIENLENVSKQKNHVFGLVFDICLYFLEKRGISLIYMPCVPLKYTTASGLSHELFMIEDPSHVLKRISIHASKNGFNNAKSNEWEEIAQENSGAFNKLWYMRDKQNVCVSNEFFSAETESRLLSKNFVFAAQFCKIVRGLWEAWDSSGLSSNERLVKINIAKRYFYSIFMPVFYSFESFKTSQNIAGFPIALCEAICSLIEGFFYLNLKAKNQEISIFNPRPISTNNVELFFSCLKQILGRDGRGVQCASAIEVRYALRKTIFSLSERMRENKNYNIPSMKSSYPQHYPDGHISRHVKEHRNVKKNAIQRALNGIDQQIPVREFHRK